MRTIIALTFTLSSASFARAAVEDPDRSATDEVSWHWVLGISGEDLETKRKAGERIVDLKIEDASPWRFAAAMVSNSGPYQRTDGFWYGYSAQQVKDKVDEKNGRILAIDAVYVDGKPRFAFSLIRNEGEAKKGWWWNYDRTVDQITSEINEHKIRLVSLRGYATPAGRRYVYVGIENEGVDGRAWWWYPDETPASVKKLLDTNKARLIAIDRPSAGHLSVIMVQDPSPRYWWWAYGEGAERTTEIYSTHGVRIAALDSYLSDGKRRYAFVGIDNTNAETARLRGYLDRTYDNQEAFGDDVIRGVLVKQVGGPIFAQLAAHLRFQPLSMLKLLPYLYVWDMIDRGAKDPVDHKTTTLTGTSLSWTEATADDPSTTPTDERDDASCLTPGSPGTKQNSAKLEDALPTMMWFSHNRTLDAVLAHYGPDKITARGHALGLKDTEMHYGCPQGSDQQPWAANRTTLMDIDQLYEDVQLGKSLEKASSRSGFFDDLIRLDYAGAKYTSPYTGNTLGPCDNGNLRDLIDREAGASKHGQVEEFLKRVVLHGKGGSGGPNGDEIGYSDSLFVELPVYEGGKIASRSYVATWFIYKLRTPAGCPDTAANDGGKCQAIWKPENDVRETFKLEMFAAPIRDALKTWPDKP